MKVIDIKSKREYTEASDILKICALAALVDVTQEINAIMQVLAECSPKGLSEFAGIIDKLPAEQADVFMHRLALHADNLKRIASAIETRAAKDPARYADLDREKTRIFANECDGYIHRHTPIIDRHIATVLDLEKTE